MSAKNWVANYECQNFMNAKNLWVTKFMSGKNLWMLKTERQKIMNVKNLRVPEIYEWLKFIVAKI